MELEVRLEKIIREFGKIELLNDFNERIKTFYNNTNQSLSESNNIFFELNISKNLDNRQMDIILEQLEIAFQILINKGHYITIYCSQEQHIDRCKAFVEVFKSKFIELLEDVEWSSKVNLKFSSAKLAVFMNSNNLLYSVVLEKPFLGINIEETICNKISMENIFITLNDFNAGIIVEKLKNIESNYEDIKLAISKLFNKSDEDLFQKYKVELKQQIYSMINQGLLKEAMDVVSEYSDIDSNDIDIYSIKGVIHIMKNELDKAEELLKKGLILDNKNVDILYNLGYLYEIQNNIELAVAYYHQVLDNTEDEELINSVKNALKSLE